MEYIIDANDDPVLICNILTGPIYKPCLKTTVGVWLNENCPNWKYNGIVILSGEYNEGLSMEFKCEADFIGFKLRWS